MKLANRHACLWF